MFVKLSYSSEKLKFACTRIIFHLVFYLFIGYSTAQPIFQRTYSGADGVDPTDIIQTDDGGFLISGNELVKISLITYNHPILIRTDSIGTIIWSYSYGGSNTDNVQRMIQTNDGNYVMVGGTSSLGPFGMGLFGDSILANILLTKVDSIGNVMWSYTYGDTLEEYGSDIIETITGDLVITGKAKQYGLAFDNSGDILLMCVSKDGILKWSKTIASIDSLIETGFSMQAEANGGFYISGANVDSYNSLADIFLIKCDSLGNVLWSKRMGENKAASLPKMMPDNNGGIVLAFASRRFDILNGDLIMTNINSAGNIIWTRKYGNVSGGSDNITAFINLKQSGYIWASFNRICAIDTIGNVIWSRNSTTFFSNTIFHILKNNNSSLNLIGTNNFTNQASICFIQMDSIGNNCDAGIFYIYPNSSVILNDTAFAVVSNSFYLTVDSGFTRYSIILSDSSYCNAYTGIENKAETTKFILYPNPSHHEVFVLSSVDPSFCTYTLFNLTGQIMFTIRNTRNVISLDSLPKGLYILKINYHSEIYYYKILKI